MTGAEILVKSLQDLGVSHVFGYTGATILPVFHALANASIKITVNANEQSSGVQRRRILALQQRSRSRGGNLGTGDY